MTYMLQSTVTVADPTGRFPIVTPFGLADPDLGRFYYAQKAAGLEMTAAQYGAFKTFVDALKAAGVWSSMKEIYPIFGTTMSGVQTKLLRRLAPIPLAPVNNLGLGQVERDGTGTVLGVAAGRPYSNNNSPAFDTSVPISALAGGCGFTFYADASALPYLGSPRNLAAAYLDPVNGSTAGGFGLELAWPDNATRKLQLYSGGLQFATPHVDPMKGVINTKMSGGQASIRVAGAEVASGAIATSTTPGLSPKTLWLLAKNPASGGTITQGYNGALRFAAIDDGSLDTTKRAALEGAVIALMGALGRTYQ